MNDRERLDRIRVLHQRAECLPVSPQRDWILSEVRSRLVDIESGTGTAPLRPLVPEASVPQVPTPPAESRKRPKRLGAPVRSATVRVRPPAPASLVVPDHRVAPLEEGVRLCLDDDEAGDRSSLPWARGLRG